MRNKIYWNLTFYTKSRPEGVIAYQFEHKYQIYQRRGSLVNDIIESEEMNGLTKIVLEKDNNRGVELDRFWGFAGQVK